MQGLLLLVLLVVLVTPLLTVVALVRTARLERRIRDLESEARAQKRAAAVSAPAQGPRPEPVALTARPAPAAPTPTTNPPLGVRPPARPSGATMEMLIGTRWLNVAGVITLLFGVAFFLKYAYENAWIGPRGRVAIGIAAGLASILIGEATRRRGHRIFSQGLTGGGVAALYLSFFFAFRLYSLVEIAPAFAMMAAVTVCGVALALLQDSLAVAVLSFVGAYLTPVLLSTGQDAAAFLFTYLAILALGALGATYFKRWRALDILAFAGTTLLYAGWYAAHYAPERFPVAFEGLAVLFFIFMLVPYGHNLARRVLASPSDHVLSVANATFAFGYLYRMLYHVSPGTLGFIALGLSVCYLGLNAIARRRLPEDRRLAISILGISIVFLTLAVPLQLGLHGITLAWAAEGLAILYFGVRYETFHTRAGGVCVLSLSVIRLFVRHVPLHTQPFTILWNPTFGTWLFVVGALFGAAALYRRSSGRLATREAHLASVALVAGALLLLVGLHLETSLYVTLWSRPADLLAGARMILWAVYPVVVFLAGHAIKDRPLKTVGVGLTLVSTVPFLMLVDRVTAAPDPLFGSFVFWMGVLGVASFFLAASLVRRWGVTLAAEPPVHRWLAGAGTALLLLLLTAEVHSHYRLMPGTPEETAANGFFALLAVSVLWALFASVLMAVGFARASRAARFASFGLYGLTLMKVFLFDMSELQTIYRVVSFLMLGLLLVIASFVYSRFRSRIAMVWVAVALLAGSLVWADFDPTRWRFRREIDVTSAAGDAPFAWVTLDDEALEASRADLADLRIVDRNHQEVSCVVSPRRGSVRETIWTSRILNRSSLPGGAARADLEFDGKQTRNLLRVETAGESFRRRVMVQGSDDGVAWATLVEDSWIYRVPATVGAAGARLEEVTLPENDYRRLRVTVFPMPDEKRPVTLVATTARRSIAIPPETIPLRVSFSVATDPNTKTTSIDIDFGYRNARPLEVSFEFEEKAFSRAYRVYGRPEERSIIERGRTETGDRIEQEVETSWRPFGSGVFLRTSHGDAGGNPIDDARIALQGEAARFLRVTLEDQDNRPLRLRGVTAKALVHRLVFPLRPGGAYVLYYGNPTATRPSYDLPDLLPDLDRKPPVAARLGPVTTNPSHEARRETPFSERSPWTLWAVVAAAVAVLALVVVRNARAIQSR